MRSIMVVALAGLALAACGGGASPDGGATAGAGATAGVATAGDATGDGAAVTLVDFDIEAPTAAPAGTTFTVTNEGGVAHTWTADDGTFDTGTIEPGGEQTVTVEEPGTYAYTCTIHPQQMTGSIEITG